MNKILQLISVATATLTFTCVTACFNSSEAATINYSFQVFIDSGYFSGNNYSGVLSYNDTNLTGLGEEFIDVFDVYFNFQGFDYTVTNNPQAAFLNGQFLGFSYSSNPSFSFIPGFFNVSEAYFAYSFGTLNSGFGDVTYTLQNTSIPESTTVIGLIAMGAWGITSRLKRSNYKKR